MSSTGKTVIWLCVVFTLVIANQVPPQVQSSTTSTPTCGGLKNKLEMRNITYKIFASDDHLDICMNNSTTCCSRQMENRLHKLSREALQSITTAKTDLIKKIFSEGLTKFNDFFKDLINDSEKQMHRTFQQIYQGAYVNNSHITKALYSNLRKYYSDGGLHANEIIKGFFQDIFQKMFVLLNPKTKVDIDCIVKKMETVNPFGNVPRTISIQVERSFTAARTFVYGIQTGKRVVDMITARRLADTCLKSVTRMTQCSLCDGQNNLKPCAGYCKSVYTDCFASLMELEQVWDDYLKNMQLLALALEGPYDIEAVALDLSFEISSGIMNYQRQSPTVTTKLVKLCPQNKKRTGRSLSSSDGDFFLENNGRVKRNARKPSRRAGKPSLDILLKKYREHLKQLSKFWTNLSEAMCDETVVADNSTDKHCWNGAQVVNNTKPVYQQPTSKTVMKNGQTDSNIKQMLNSVTNSLKAAINGMTVDFSISWTKEGDGEDDFSGSGSGSGSGFVGSGEGPITIEITKPNVIHPTDNLIGQQTPPECNNINCVNVIGPSEPDIVMGDRDAANSFSASVFLFTVTLLLHVILTNC